MATDVKVAVRVVNEPETIAKVGAAGVESWVGVVLEVERVDAAESVYVVPLPIAVIVNLYAVPALNPVIVEPEVNPVMAEPTSVVPSEAR